MMFEIVRYTREYIDENVDLYIEAFHEVYRKYNVRKEFQTREGALEAIFLLQERHPGSYSLMAIDPATKKVVGHVITTVSVPLSSPRTPGQLSVASIGPVSVSPHYQGKGIAMKLMQALCEVMDEKKVDSLRLMQDAFNPISFSLYLRSQFMPKEAISILEGMPDPTSIEHLADLEASTLIRKITLDDLDACDRLYGQAHPGFSRRLDLETELKTSKICTSFALIDKNTQEFVGYSASIPGHSVCKTEDYFKILFVRTCHLSSAEKDEYNRKNGKTELTSLKEYFYCPWTSHPGLLKWGVECAKLKIWRNETHMVRGVYCVNPEMTYIPDCFQ
ncbi:uncharacterized protein LOC126318329 [Schistocerca gregaria]|uniref:uncharacterized protein LOC126318329 n=1 Tax=Schistocerca gregaria TaxID=7010 RepID=UPI00211E600B|nr:uncharacterized protein LOC126318329 [Schistocerca gregaria]